MPACKTAVPQCLRGVISRYSKMWVVGKRPRIAYDLSLAAWLTQTLRDVGRLGPQPSEDSGNPPGGLRPQGCGLGLAGLFHRTHIQLSSVKGDGKGLEDRDLNFLFGHFVWRRAKGDDLVSAVIISGKMAVFPEVGILPDPHLWVARQAAQWREVNQFYTQGVSLLCSGAPGLLRALPHASCCSSFPFTFTHSPCLPHGLFFFL